MHDVIYDVQDMALRTMGQLVQQGEMNDSTLCELDKLVDIYKDIVTIEGMESYDDRNSRSSYNSGYSNARGRGRIMMGRERSSMNNGYSRGGDMYGYLEEAMNNATTDVERDKIRRFMDELGHM